MPIRVYDLAVKLGVDPKDLLAVAKELGITAARVPSSSLDKITGEYLAVHVEDRLLDGTIQKVSPTSPPAGKDLRRVLQNPPRQTAQPQPVKPRTDVRIQEKASAIAPARNRDSPVTSEPGYLRFERSVRRILEQAYPCCTLSNVLLFHSEKAQFAVDPQEQTIRSDYAFELDHLLHRADARTDNLIVIECKNQTIRVQDERTWLAHYKSGVSNVQPKLRRQAEALRAYINPLSRGRKLLIDVLVVSSDSKTDRVHCQIRDDLAFHLCNQDYLSAALQRMGLGFKRVAQSDILNLIRLGMPIAELGHPELNNALAYIERCRRSIDLELFRAFSPTPERWAINGSAGMGKSVLLAYSLFVFTSNRRVDVQNGARSLSTFSREAAAIGLPPLGQRGVYAFALKEKQRAIISRLYRRFVDEFASLSKEVDLDVSRPTIRLWNGTIPSDCQVLLIDEAHDLSSADGAKLVAWANAPGERRYLLIACDRHQKLRLVGRDEAIIEGINFSRKTKKLRLNYRNPFSVYATSLGLMFRWFARTGPKVLPTKDDLENGFGFTVGPADAGRIPVSMRNDAHPGNSWSHCVEWFVSPEAALARLRPFRFNPQDVLWVRFTDEDEQFDYEQLGCFTYHNLNCAESVELTDKYIKGQDFPIVVIEGFSEDMNKWSGAA